MTTTNIVRYIDSCRKETVGLFGITLDQNLETGQWCASVDRDCSTPMLESFGPTIEAALAALDADAERML